MAKKTQTVGLYSLIIQAFYILIWVAITVFAIPWIVRSVLTPVYGWIMGFERSYTGMYYNEEMHAIIMDPAWYDFYTSISVLMSAAFGLLCLWHYFRKFYVDVELSRMTKTNDYEE